MAAVVLLENHLASAATPQELPPVRFGPKPVDAAIERRPHPQPKVPEGAKEIPFDETVPEPALTEPEKVRGYLLFQRPLTESVYPNTRPLPHERIEALVAFAAPGEFEPVTFALYPVRPLQNLKVRGSSLTCPSGEIPADRIDVRLATYWNVGFPAYTTLSTYRRVPELLERVTAHSSPAGECQRYWLTVHVPDDAKPGLYRGTVTVWDDGFGQAVEIPLALRVLGFRLQKDPRKHFSVYFYARNKRLSTDSRNCQTARHVEPTLLRCRTGIGAGWLRGHRVCGRNTIPGAIRPRPSRNLAFSRLVDDAAASDPIQPARD